MRQLLLAILIFGVAVMPIKAESVDELIARIRAERMAALARWEAVLPSPTPTQSWIRVERYPKPIITSDWHQYGERDEIKAAVRSRYIHDHDDDPKTPEQYEWWTETRVVPAGGEIFTWEYDGELAEDEYFQVMLICPNGEHRGIHAPTKQRYTIQGDSLRYVVQDCKGAQTRPWNHESFQPVENIDIQYTVAVIKWDGKDPSRIGPILIEADPVGIKI